VGAFIEERIGMTRDVSEPGESRVSVYRRQLTLLDDWEPYLLRESGLPGPRGNIELAQAAASEGTLPQFLAFLMNGPDQAPYGTAREFLAFCGVVGLGAEAARGGDEWLPVLRSWANDPRWRVREAVAMALQRVGEADVLRLHRALIPWCSGSPLERRAVVAGVAEPKLLVRADAARAALRLVEVVVRSVLAEGDRTCDEFLALRKGLGYAWSVVVVATPDEGKASMERWLRTDDSDIRWILRENLGKNRLARMDTAWVARTQRRLGGPQRSNRR
jgi:hypothetical protein